MFGLPFHPLFIHIPLGITIVVPFIALGQTIAIGRNWVPPKVWIAVIALLAALFVSCFIAENSGDAEEQKVVKFVRQELIEQHAEAADLFTTAAGVTLGFAIAAWVAVNWAPLFARKKDPGKLPQLTARLGSILRIATVVLTFLMLAQGMQTGHRGGLLVYTYGACRAYLPASSIEIRQGTRVIDAGVRPNEK